tara:strand:- start:34 stop:984 length:951 start_codon:yes stop_codon:yes gene_type:complete
MINEIKYETENRRDRATMQSYHRSPSPRDHSKGAKDGDIANLKSASKRNLITLDGNTETRFTIGMEVEKARFQRGAVREYSLFAGFERDSSCGYEAVTNILPLLPSGKWRNKVFNMMFEARNIIEDSKSPSDLKCGGHITIGVQGMSGAEVMKAVRKNMGIVYALFYKRLNNGYCRSNLTMLDKNEVQGSDMMNGFGRYSAVLDKGATIEFRLVSRFQSVKQMMRRYELMYELLDFSINNPNGSHNSFLNKVMPIVKSMYNGDMEMVEQKMSMAKAFRTMIIKNKVNRDVINYVDPMRRMDARKWYDRDLQRNGSR